MKPDKIVISNLQFFILIVGGTIAFGHFVYSHLIILYAGRDGWLAVFASLLFGLAITYLLFRLADLQRSRSLVDHIGYVWGTWAGVSVGSIYIVYFLFVGGFTFHLLSTFLGSVYLLTPREIWVIFLFLAIAWAMYAGLEVVARSVQFLLPILIFFGILAAILAMPDRDFSQLFPILYKGVFPMWRGTLIMIAMYSELVVFLMITPDVKNRNALVKQGFMLTLVLTVMYVGPIVGPIMIFGERIAQSLTYPTYTEMQYLKATPVLERLDLIAVVLWTVGAYIRVSLYGLCALRAVTDLSKTQQHNIYSIPVAFLLVGMGLWMPLDRADDFSFLMTAYPVIALLMGMVIPALLLLSTIFKEHRQKRCAR